jgi:peroxiredoxin Q/BCP
MDEFEARGLTVWAISPEPVDKLARYVEQKRIRFAMLSDPDAAVIRQWGLANPDRPAIPHPTAIVVDAEGVIRYYRQDVDFTVRPAPEELMAAADAMASEVGTAP